MTTPSYGGTDPLTTSTPIGDELAQDAGVDPIGSASEHAAGVAETAKDEAAKVASEAKGKATDLLADVKTQVDEQSKAQLQGLAAKLGELADEIESMVNSSEAGGTVTGVAQQLADKTHQLSSHLESRQPLDLLEDVRGFARRRPTAFLAGAAVAGVLAGRLTRGAKASQDSSPTSSTTPAPTYAPPTGDPITFADDVPAGQNTGGRQ